VSVLADIGSTVTLHCCDRAKVNATFKLLFQPPDQTSYIFLYNGKETAASHKSRLTMDIDKATLLPLFHIVNVTVNDAGLYHCVEIIYDESSESTSQFTELTVLSM
jgi:Immunoglobulin V-set domain